MNKPSPVALIAAFATIYLVWGTTYLAIALVVHQVPPFVIGALRFGLAGLLMAGMLRLRQARPFAGLPWASVIAAGVLLSGIGNGFVIWGQQTVPSGIAALLVAALPLWIMFFDSIAFARRRPGFKDIAGSLIGLCGVLLIVAQTRRFDGVGGIAPTLMILIATFGWSIGTLVQRQAVKPGQLMAFAAAQMLVGAAFQGMCALALGEWSQLHWTDFTPTAVGALVYLAIFGSIVAFSAYLWLVTKVPTSAVATYSLANPVVAMALGAWLLGERVEANAIAASVLVLAGVALVLWPTRRNVHGAMRPSICTAVVDVKSAP
ncbi:MAG: EamA family transporter [Tahibacter sp.]